MYLFVAHYINMDTDEEIKRKIEIEEQFFLKRERKSSVCNGESI